METRHAGVSATAKAELHLCVEAEIPRMLEVAASHEGRSMADILEDAVRLYLRSQSEDYQAHLTVARRFLDAPEGSDERALAGVELSARLAQDRGRVRREPGGDARVIRARLRRQARPGDAD